LWSGAPWSGAVATARPTAGPLPGREITTMTATMSRVAEAATATPTVRRRLEGIGISTGMPWRGS
jgi:hypothetical protein